VRPGQLLPALALGIFLGALDMNILALALTRLSTDFDIPQAATVWIVVTYSAAYMVAMPIVGRLGDLFGRRQAFMAGVAVFTVGSLLCAASGWAGNWLWLLLLGRVVQGLGAGGLVPVATALISEHIAPDRRGKALGVVGMTFGGASILGPILGGALIDPIGWEWLFALNVPLGFLAWRLADAMLPDTWPRDRGQVDWAGGVLLTIALSSLIIGAELVASNLKELSSPFFGFAGPALIGSAVAFYAFLVWERLADSPMLDLGLYRRGPVRVAFVLALLYGAGMIVAMVFTPIFFHYRFHLATWQSALGLLPMAAAVGFASMKGGKLSDAWGPRQVLLLGFACFAVGLGLLAWLAPWAPLPLALLALAVAGLGFGFCQAPLTHAVLQATDDAQAGQASGAVNTHRSLGGIVGATAGALLIADAMSRVGSRMIAEMGPQLPPMCIIPRVVDPNHVADVLKMLPPEARAKALADATAIVSQQMVSGLSSLYAAGAATLALALLIAFALPGKAKAEPKAPAEPEAPAPEARAA
jgi:EmrB/QacA subfamily drug resistance transporter